MNSRTVKAEPRLIREREGIPVTTLVLAVALLTGCALVANESQTVHAGKEYVVCSFYGDKAQSVYDSNPVKYSKLDRDGDGKACE